MPATKKQPIMPDFSGLIQAQAGKKIQPQPPVPGSSAKTRAKTKTETRKQPAWMRKTPPVDDTSAETVTVADMEILPSEQEETTGSLALEPMPRDVSAAIEACSYDREIRDQAIQRVIDGEPLTHVCKDMHIDRRTLQRWVAELRDERAERDELDSMVLADKFTGAAYELVSALDKAKAAKASVKDIAIAIGILTDKRKELLGPRSGGNSLHLRAVFRGEGAIEVHTGD